MTIFGKASNSLINRCKAAKIEYRELEESEEYFASLILSLKAGRKKREIFFDEKEDINEFLEIDFENYSFLDRYDAIYSPEKSAIEASIFSLQWGPLYDASELRGFFTSKKKHDFFLKKNKEITEVTIPLNDRKVDLIKSVASRVYDIRCRIVHTKDISGVTKPLLPNSEGAENLNHDIALVEFLAKKVIISGSCPLDP